MRAMILCAVAALAASSIRAQELTRTDFPDGSGSVGVAAGWKVTSSGNGAVTMGGPNGASMTLGMPVPVVSRNVAAKFPDIPDAALFPGSPRVDFRDPVRAALDLFAFADRKTPGTFRVTRLRAVEPTRMSNGPGAFVRLAASVRGKPIESFALWAILPIDDVQGLFYFSAVQAPAADYARQLPLMMAMWRSWSLSDATVKARLESAQKALAEVDVNGAVDSVLANRRQAAEEAARKWNVYLRQ